MGESWLAGEEMGGYREVWVSTMGKGHGRAVPG